MIRKFISFCKEVVTSEKRAIHERDLNILQNRRADVYEYVGAAKPSAYDEMDQSWADLELVRAKHTAYTDANTRIVGLSKSLSDTYARNDNLINRNEVLMGTLKELIITYPELALHKYIMSNVPTHTTTILEDRWLLDCSLKLIVPGPKASKNVKDSCRDVYLAMIDKFDTLDMITESFPVSLFVDRGGTTNIKTQNGWDMVGEDQLTSGRIIRSN